jgi:ribonucleotide monophosphatase NagD (HAD superfamily)
MIGDSIEADVAGRRQRGLKAALVRAGKFRSSDLERAVQPHLVFDTIANLPRWGNGQSA